MSTLDLPLAPSVNALWRANRGRVHRSARYVAWQKEAGWELLRQKPKRLAGKVLISIAAGRPDKRRRDVDNLVKPLPDLLVAHQVIEDDAGVAAVDVRWDELVPKGRVCLEVKRQGERREPRALI